MLDQFWNHLNERDGTEISKIPASRVCVFVGHSATSEKQRLSLWKRGVVAIDTAEALLKWVLSRPKWPARGELDLDDEVDSGAKYPKMQRAQRQNSTEIAAARLEGVRARVEALEQERARILDEDEQRRRDLRNRAMTVHSTIVESVNERLAAIDAALAIGEDSSTVDETESVVPDDDDIPDGSGRDAALVLASVFKLQEAPSRTQRLTLMAHRRFLVRLALTSKVMAKVQAPMHKKLLNLARDWLQTYLPHCLSKVNRVSFGLLDERDIERALAYDPRMPRSRLKLAVPFVGKDVPSSASEFAHPDVTIGMTCFAYRYSGLRREDFDELVDALTADFAREIGPAHDRTSSRRHESWVRSAGGSIRGLDETKGIRTGEKHHDESKTVVQLKFLQKSNEEQMDKLFELWRKEPLALHHYLETFVFPTHMRSQRQKISASGQAIGGDMLFDRRVGFSGTPSDLLPNELGQCQYEKGDDGKMLATVLDPEVCSTHEMPKGWSIEDLIELAATATEPRIHALIDTGALVTGRTNKQVATELLKRGLPWCDGVVYLDDDDKKQVLVRATMRAMPEEQCGVPLERRFAFYDQVHTTGQDIKHVANATALVTLGHQMVWRDYAQGLYRMRGIAAGQRVRVVVIPEVRRLIERELAACSDTEASMLSPLAEIVAWLIINSLRAEQLQWSMLCAQNIANVYRKEAFRILVKADARTQLGRIRNDHDSTVPERALAVFEEPIDFSLEATVPDPIPFEERLKSLLDAHREFASRNEQTAVANRVLSEVGRYALTDRRGRGAKRLDTEQEREQEQEAQKEVRARKDQQVEVEKFVEREYSRNEEAPRAWPLTWLSAQPPGVGEVPDHQDGDHPFYPLADFALRHHEALEFPSQLLVSRNYFRRSWTGLRRLKNVVVVLEWAPEGSRASARLRSRAEQARDRGELTIQQRSSLNKAHALFAAGDRVMDAASLIDAVEVVEDIGRRRTENEIDLLLSEFGGVSRVLDAEAFARLVSSGALAPESEGRYWVAVNLAEAETLRRCLHVRADRTLFLKDSSESPEIALHYSPLATADAASHSSHVSSAGDGGLILDATRNWWNTTTGATASEAAIAHNAFRFFDGDVHFSEQALHALIRALRRAPPRRRERFFAANIGARRRLERSPRRAPLGRVFTVSDEYAYIARRATAVFLRSAIKKKGFTWWGAFAAFDDSNTGTLGPSEVYGALRYLGAGDFVDADDVLDFVALAANPDNNRTDNDDAQSDEQRALSFQEFVDALRVDADEDEDTTSSQNKSQLKIEPYGAEEIRDALLRRRRAAIEDAAAERARAEARAQELDRRTYDEELQEAERKHGALGVNPRVTSTTNGETLTIFSFGYERKPLRCKITRIASDSLSSESATSSGTNSALSRFVPLDLERISRKPVPPLACACGRKLRPYDSSWERCSRCKPRDRRGCTRICYYCYARVCERCVQAHHRAIVNARADPSGKATFLLCQAGAALSLQLPAKAFAGTNDSLLRQFTLTAEFRLDRAPPTAAALVRLAAPRTTLNKPGRGEVEATLAARRALRATIYVTKDGSILTASQISHEDGKSLHNANTRIVFGRWCAVTLVVDANAGELDVYIQGKAALSARDIATSELTLGTELTFFSGDKLAHARGGGIRHCQILNTKLSKPQVVDLALQCARDNPEIDTCVTKIQALVRARPIFRKYKEQIEAEMKANAKSKVAKKGKLIKKKEKAVFDEETTSSDEESDEEESDDEESDDEDVDELP